MTEQNACVPEPVSCDDPRAANPTGFVVVRLASALPGTVHETLDDVASSLDLPSLGALLSQFELKSRRLASKLDPRRLRELEKLATRSTLAPLHSLTRYWRLDARHCQDCAPDIVEQLRSLAEVDTAYPLPAVGDPVVDPSDDTYAAAQGHLDAAPVGIDARWAFTQPGADGAGIGFVDLEQAWEEKHEDLFVVGDKIPHLIFGANRAGDLSLSDEGFQIPFPGDHGTAVLGIAVAEDNDLGVVGVAPGVRSVRLASHFDGDSSSTSNLVDAILGSIDDGKASKMKAGDVLLLEVQTFPGLLPVEIDDAVFDAIRLASAIGIVVVEAAGNGGGHLDSFTSPDGVQILNRDRRGFRDSGAIMVGACRSDLNADDVHERAEFSGHGSRIDCHAWGENVVTCGYGDLDPGEPETPPGGDGGDVDLGDDGVIPAADDDGIGLPTPTGNAKRSYTESFGGTSAASAIIAGAALVVQGKHQADAGTRLSPLQMRALLSDPATGTPHGDALIGAIGVMPDLKAIISEGLRLVPDVYCRNYVGDSGAVPSAFDDISRSPDVIVSPFPVADPVAVFGQGSGTEDDYTLAHVEEGQDNFVYVRLHNRGSGIARGVTARVYWSELLSLIEPSAWQFIGATDPVDVPSGNTITVAGPVAFRATSPDLTPKSSSFLVLVDHPDDPAPPIPTDLDAFWNFYAFIRNNNNVTWHGFRVVDDVPDPQRPGEFAEFFLTGAPDRARRFDIEIDRHLPTGARLWWEVPLGAVAALGAARDWPTRIDRRRSLAVLELPALPTVRIPDVRLGPADRHRCRFIVEGTAEMDRGGHEVTLRQVFEGTEVGRLNWRLAPRTCAKHPSSGARTYASSSP